LRIKKTVELTLICSTVDRDHAESINDLNGPTTTLCEHIREYQRINVIDRADEPAKARTSKSKVAMMEIEAKRSEIMCV